MNLGNRRDNVKILTKQLSRRWPPGALALVVVLGCTDPDPADERPAFNPGALVPATGVVTIKGRPLGNAVVTFLPEIGYPGVGETAEDGKFVLKSGPFRGVSPGDYKVAVSYLVAADGTPQGMGARGSLVVSQSLLSAKELLPLHYSDLGRTTLRAKVPRQGGTFKFDLDASLPVPEKGRESPAVEAQGDEAEKP